MKNNVNKILGFLLIAAMIFNINIGLDNKHFLQLGMGEVEASGESYVFSETLTLTSSATDKHVNGYVHQVQSESQRYIVYEGGNLVIKRNTATQTGVVERTIPLKNYANYKFIIKTFAGNWSTTKDIIPSASSYVKLNGSYVADYFIDNPAILSNINKELILTQSLSNFYLEVYYGGCGSHTSGETCVLSGSCTMTIDIYIDTLNANPKLSLTSTTPNSPLQAFNCSMREVA